MDMRVETYVAVSSSLPESQMNETALPKYGIHPGYVGGTVPLP